MKRIYLDYAASSPVDPEVARAMELHSGTFGNPGSLHSFGQSAIALLDGARETVAESIGAGFREIVFTSSATEANNLALRGAFLKFGRGMRQPKRPRIVISEIEHESVLETAREIERMGAELVVVPVDGAGVVDPAKIKGSITDETILVSVMYANNEIGTVEPVAEIAKIVAVLRGRGAYPLFHTDAAQALQFLDCGVKDLGADFMTLSSHKICGPKGAAALFVKERSALAPVMSGGGQEFGLRSGTENVQAIAGFAKAAAMAAASRAEESERLASLRARLWDGIRAAAPDAEVNGIEPGKDPQGTRPTLPGILNVWFPGRPADLFLAKLDMKGLAVSAGSACRARAPSPSYVVKALRRPQADSRARQSIRFSMGRATTAEEIEEAIAIVKESA